MAVILLEFVLFTNILVESTESQDGLTWNTLIPLQTSEYKIINYQLYILRKRNTLKGSWTFNSINDVDSISQQYFDHIEL